MRLHMKCLACLSPMRQRLCGSPGVQQHGIWGLLRQLLLLQGVFLLLA